MSKDLSREVLTISDLARRYGKRLNKVYPSVPDKVELQSVRDALEVAPWPELTPNGANSSPSHQSVLQWLKVVRQLTDRGIDGKSTSPFEWLVAAEELENAEADLHFDWPSGAYQPPPDAFTSAKSNIPLTCNPKQSDANSVYLDKVNFVPLLALAELVLAEARDLADWAADATLNESGAVMLMRTVERWLALESALADNGIAGSTKGWMAWNDRLGDVATYLRDLTDDVRKHAAWFVYIPCHPINLLDLAPTACMGMPHNVFAKRLTVVVKLLREVVRENENVPAEDSGKAQRRRMTVEEANDKAIKLAKKLRRRFFLLSERDQAAEIGCSWATWNKTPFSKKAKEWKDKLDKVKQKNETGTRMAVDYDEVAAVETAVGGDEGLNKLIAEEEAQRREKEIGVLKAQQEIDDDQNSSKPRKKFRHHKRA